MDPSFVGILRKNRGVGGLVTVIQSVHSFCSLTTVCPHFPTLVHLNTRLLVSRVFVFSYATHEAIGYSGVKEKMHEWFRRALRSRVLVSSATLGASFRDGPFILGYS